MMILVMGGANSGKSDLAEDLALCGGYLRRYYIATMRVMDEEGRLRRERHRAKRAGKGFETLEIPYRIDVAPDIMTDKKNCSVILECVANLVGNAMHEPEWSGRLVCASPETIDELTDHIMGLITDLASQVGQLVVVSYVADEKDKEKADDKTRLYLSVLETVNKRLSRIADKVYIK